MAQTKSWWKKIKKEIKKNNEANWMVSYSAKLDSRTKQHTQFGVLAEKRKKLKKKNNKANWMISYSAKRERFSVALYAIEERSPEDEKL